MRWQAFESTIEKHVGLPPAREKYTVFVQCNIFYCIASKQSLYKGCVEIRGDGTNSPSARAE
jgi:hypothetical protein